MPLDLTIDNAAAVAARVKALGWIDADDELLALQPAGAGNMNRTLRARFAHRSLILKQSVPFVAKYPSIAAPPERIAVEAAFYAATAAAPELAQRLPRVLGYDPDNRLLALQDLGTASDLTGCYADSTVIYPARRAALLDWLGRLHAHSIDPTAQPLLENHAMRELNHAHIFDIPLRADNGLDLDAITPGLGRVAHELQRDDTLRHRLHALGEIYLGRAPHDSAPALLHGDYYPGSWLATADDLYVIDPEFAFVGAAEFDLGVLIAHFTFARISQDELTAALAHYRAPAGFSLALALAFAGAEVIRRLLGVAQLPLAADLTLKATWLTAACTFVMTP
jgi:5-methylthioribose kinase